MLVRCRAAGRLAAFAASLVVDREVHRVVARNLAIMVADLGCLNYFVARHDIDAVVPLFVAVGVPCTAVTIAKEN